MKQYKQHLRSLVVLTRRIDWMLSLSLLVGEYGVRRKRELWRVQYALSRIQECFPVVFSRVKLFSGG
ncbi:hypothetical protein LguiB_024903 [Lonicera macranthoides]